MAPPTYRQHETAFCAEVSKWSDKLFEAETDLEPTSGKSDSRRMNGSDGPGSSSFRDHFLLS